MKQLEGDPPTFTFTFPSREQTQSHSKLLGDKASIVMKVGRGELRMRDTLPLGDHLVDVVCRALVYTSEKEKWSNPDHRDTRFLLPSVACSHQEAMKSICEINLPGDRVSWTIMPLRPAGQWSLLVVEHGGRTDDL